MFLSQFSGDEQVHEHQAAISYGREEDIILASIFMSLRMSEGFLLLNREKSQTSWFAGDKKCELRLTIVKSCFKKFLFGFKIRIIMMWIEQKSKPEGMI